MKRFFRSPASLIILFFCLISLSGLWFLIRSPGDPGPVSRQHVRLERIRALTGPDGARPALQSFRGKTKEARPAFRVNLPAELSAEVEIGEGGFLDFGLTFDWPGTGGGRRYLLCSVHADRGEGFERLIEERRYIQKGNERWIDYRADLSGLPPGKTVLRFRIREMPRLSDRLRQPLRVFLSRPLLFGGRETGSRGSIIYYLVDTLRADHLTCYGYPRNVSPYIHALSGDGVLFHSLYAQASWTAPSAATMFSSLYPADHGLETQDDRISENVEMLAEILARDGYRTKAFVANGFVSASYNFHQGFDSYVECPGEEKQGHALGEDIVERAAAWLRENGQQKFFLYLHTVDPHSPYDPPEPFRSRFDRGIQSDVRGDHGEKSYRKARNLTESDIGHLRDLYDGEIAYTDACFGYLMRVLKALGIYRDTTIVLTSDHGEEFWEHGGWGHGKSLYVEQLHIPMIIKFGRNRGAGTVVKSRTETLDIMPTLLGAAGVEAGSDLAGQDLYSVLFDRSPIGKREIISETNKGPHRLFSVLDGRYKYILRKAPAFQEALYDIRTDPLETRNIAGTHGREREALRQTVARYLSEKGRGFHLLFQGGGADDIVQIDIQGVHRFRTMDILGYRGDPPEGGEVTAGKDGHRILLRDLSAEREVIFFPEDEGAFCIGIQWNGVPADPASLRLGEKGASPGDLPICVDAYQVDGVPIITGKPRIVDVDGPVCYLWAKDPAREKAVRTEDNIRNLRALGYLE
jgi:arylsulfatase A-like enzyme